MDLQSRRDSRTVSPPVGVVSIPSVTCSSQPVNVRPQSPPINAAMGYFDRSRGAVLSVGEDCRRSDAELRRATMKPGLPALRTTQTRTTAPPVKKCERFARSFGFRVFLDQETGRQRLRTLLLMLGLELGFLLSDFQIAKTFSFLNRS